MVAGPLGLREYPLGRFPAVQPAPASSGLSSICLFSQLAL